MTIDERFERIEHVTAGLAEQQRKEWEEARALWRDTQRQLNELTQKDAEARERMDRMEAQTRQRMDRMEARMDREREESRAESQRLDRRVDALVSAIGEWIRASRPEAKL